MVKKITKHLSANHNHSNHGTGRASVQGSPPGIRPVQHAMALKSCDAIPLATMNSAINKNIGMVSNS